MAGLVLFVFTLAAAPAPAVSPGGQTWLIVSDIHLDPFDRSTDPALVGSDTNNTLLDQAIAQMKHFVPNPSMVLLPGDFLVHGFPAKAHAAAPTVPVAETALRTMQRIASAFARAYPHARFALALGNNDASCGDYRTDVNGRYLAAVARIWEPLVNRDGNAPGFVSAFSHGGYYSVPLPLQGLRLVVLDTVPMSSEYRGNCEGAAPNAARGELEWLRATLAATPAGARNVVMMHIPPGYDPVSTQFTHGFVAWSFLGGSDSAALLAALEDPNSRVTYAIAGHMHRTDFRLARHVPVLLFGALSPVYRNNPSFFALRVGSDGGINDIDTYVYDEWSGEWADGARSFVAKWSVPRVDAESLAALHARLGTDESLRARWAAGSVGWPTNPEFYWQSWTGRWRIPWCAQVVLLSGYAECANIQGRVAAFWAILAVVAICVIGAIALIVTLVLRGYAR
jgi:sphingomyelin phosphodiesterase acid-like 3